MVYSSYRWVLFASRPTTILNRDFRREWYFRVNLISSINISKLLVIYDKLANFVFLDKKEHERNNDSIKKESKTGRIEYVIDKMKELIGPFSTHNELETEHSDFPEIGSIMVYTQYLEPLITEICNDKANKLCKDIIELRETVISLFSKYYQKKHQLLSKEYPEKEIDYYLLEELLSGKKVNVKHRRDFCVYYGQKNGPMQMFEENSAYEFINFEKFIKKRVKVACCVEGLGGNRGKAKGNAVIVNSIRDLNKIRKGDIVLTNMTIPQFTPYMGSVKAIVTNDGGLTCHAIVIAREFNIPCIVGTRYATFYFKDGDYIEVDADTGRVKRIE